MLLSLWLTVACAPQDEASVPAACRAYAPWEELLEHCRRREASLGGAGDELGALCSDDPVCQQRWVEARLESATPEAELLEACSGSPDCVLLVLDARADPDPSLQLQRCHQLAGPLAEDCGIHALRRWLQGPVTAESVQRVAQNAWLSEGILGRHMGFAVRCAGVGACEGRASAACEQSLQEIRERPEICSSLAP